MAAPRSDAKRSARQRLEDVDLVLGALAHPSRRQILLVLHFRGGEMAAGDIAQRFSCTWATTTRHLTVLRDAGLISVTQQGRNRFYRLERERLLGVTGDWLSVFDAPPAG